MLSPDYLHQSKHPGLQLLTSKSCCSPHHTHTLEPGHALLLRRGESLLAARAWAQPAPPRSVRKATEGAVTKIHSLNFSVGWDRHMGATGCETALVTSWSRPGPSPPAAALPSRPTLAPAPATPGAGACLSSKSLCTESANQSRGFNSQSWVQRFGIS